jgi:Universal stress protein family
MSSQQEHIDEFESLFRRAEREPFSYAEIPLRTVAVVTDGSDEDARTIIRQLQDFAPSLGTVTRWRVIAGDDYSSVSELLSVIDAEQTDLIATYRHLHDRSDVPQHSLGVYLDVMTQATMIPVLVLPGIAARPKPLTGRLCNRVMVVTDHISGDNRLINYGVRMCADRGTVWLCHVEDESVFERYMTAISRIPEIDTGLAREKLEEQLLKDAREFIEACITRLRERKPEVSYESVVARGHHLKQYRQLIDEHDADLLVANTKDDEQLAMDGMTYSLSVELLDVAMLLL